MQKPIYLDNGSTTALDNRVLELMMPYLTGEYGNAASTEHRYGWVAEEAVARARKSIAKALGARSEREIIFTSGATESNNLAILGVARAYHQKGNHLVTVETEHKAVLDTCTAWEQEGGRVTRLPVDQDGIVDLDQLERAITPETVLVSIMIANNEIGVLQPVAKIGKIVEQAGTLYHSDASQAVGKLAVDVNAMRIHLMSFSGHKLYGPKGIGGLYVSRRQPRVSLRPLIHGGGHEWGWRSGTLNVAGIVGLAEAISLSQAEMPAESKRLLALREKLWFGLKSRFPKLLLNGHPVQRLPGNLNISFPELKVEQLVRDIYGELAVSTGAACSSANPQPSHVLRAIEETDGARSETSIRFGLGRFTTVDQIEKTIEVLHKAGALQAY